jgi:putative ubiquitin-RnfH superfamily antitoxin RatB of RatAB toxin-antitoxin module
VRCLISASGFDSRQGHKADRDASEGNLNTMAERKRDTDERELADHDPVEVLRAIMAISPEDAEKVRADAAEAMKGRAESDD